MPPGHLRGIPSASTCRPRPVYDRAVTERDLYAATIKPHPDPTPVSGWRVPSLTILFHPGAPARAGEIARLLELLEGKPCALSRQEPDFAVAGAARGKPLSDRHVSRTPVRIAPDEGGGVLLQAPRGALRLDGEPATEVAVPAQDLARGVVLELADRIVLLLHELGPPAPRAPGLGMLGDSEAMEQLRGEILRVADLDVPVLLRGETGTGKERVARAIAEASRRAGPFVPVNLAAMQTPVAASELFGHVAGAFPGAGAARAGCFAQAHGGFLYLDEVGMATLEVQAMLLRALETREIQPLGADRPRKVEVRVLAATDEDLEASIRAGRFREALYQRLCSYHIDVPPLRARRDDLGVLLVHFLTSELRALDELNRLDALADSRPWLPPALVARLFRHSWPGNVRELANAARRLVLDSRGGRKLDEHALPRQIVDGPSQGPTASAAPTIPGHPTRSREPIDDQRLRAALEQHGWKVSATAQALGISRSWIYALIEASTTIRKAKDVPADEIRACHAEFGGDVDRMAEHLHVSSHGIRLRLKDLGLD
jgi:two-component system nitrogen regulation response regulator GlnG